MGVSLAQHLDERKLVVEAFAEWDRRVRSNPDAFMSEAEIHRGTPASYGEVAATFFLTLLNEVASALPEASAQT